MDSPSSVLRPKRLVLWGIAVIGAFALTLASPGTFSPAPAAAQPGALRVSAGGPYAGAVGQPVFFHAEIELGGVPPGPVEVSWDFGDGAVGSGQSAEHVYTTAGNFSVTVSVVSAGRTASDSTNAQIVGGGQGPRPGQLTVDAGGPYSGSVGQPVFFSADVGLGGRPPGTVVEVRWQFGDGAIGSGENVSHTYTAPGTFNVSVTASVGPGQTATDSTSVAISGAPPPPVLVVNPGGPYSGSVGQFITFSGSAAPIPAGTRVSFFWTFGDGFNTSGQVVGHTYNAAGTYTVTLTVTTGAGQSGSATTTATIIGAAPPPPPTTQPVPLLTGCTNVALTWPVGTPLSTVTAAVTPTTAVLSIFTLDTSTGQFRGFSPTAPAFANNFIQVETNLQAVFICTTGPATLNRPVP
ncbi:MAG: PKD domain-containing protein [Dehalococcoidia bacterium]